MHLLGIIKIYAARAATKKPVFKVILWKLEPEQRADFGNVLQKCFGAGATSDMRKWKYTRPSSFTGGLLIEQK